MFYAFDPLWLLFAVPGLLIGIWAQVKLSHAYGKYSRVAVESGMTGAQAAREILDRAGLSNVPVEEIPGHLSDHYDPAKRALFLSSENFNGRTVAAVGVAAHESGHALQHQAAYGLFNFRMAIVPVTQFASMAYVGIFFAGFIFRSFFHQFILIAILMFGIMTLFQLVTLPVEYDASRRAKEQLFRLGLVREDERTGISKVLDAAALTYVAALVSSVLQLLYLLTLARDGRR
ncbi:MAG TPA: zinc metallopeptidase [Candidatus Dormibacteraeota bacterium]|jgi:Zn-dependent membrane protease YugP|nr:zinc metallopeptidase [Candidatus Dormibacteraeota bacterium]